MYLVDSVQSCDIASDYCKTARRWTKKVRERGVSDPTNFSVSVSQPATKRTCGNCPLILIAI
jgi:hypothetical protein